MKKLTLSMLLIASVMFYSCKKETEETQKPKPSADFIYSGANTYAPAEVSFTNNSQNADTYLWDFGDNATSTEKNPKHTYTNGGVYTVTLKAMNGDEENITSKTINIIQKPTKCYIKKLYVMDMPFVDPNTGSGWDTSDGPDVFFELLDTNTVLFSDYTTRIQDVTQSMLPIYWYWNSGSYWQIPTLNDYYFIRLIDYDPYSNNENIGYVSYKMDNYMTVQNHYPDEILLSQNNITIKLEIQWGN